MRIDRTRCMTDDEYRSFMELMERRWNYEHHSCPNAPYWGDGPNALADWEKSSDDDYEDADYLEYYETLLSSDEKWECEEIELQVQEFKALMSKKYEWALVESIHYKDVNKMNKIACFLMRKEYSFILFFDPIDFQHHLYIKGEKAQVHYYLEFKSFREEYAEIMVSRYGWTNLPIVVEYHEEGFTNSKAIVDWLEKCKGTVAYDKFAYSSTRANLNLYFENMRDAIHFRMIV